MDIPVFFRAHPGARVTFSCVAKRKVTKEKATPRTRPSHILVLRTRSHPPGFADGPSLGLRRTGAHPVRHPSDLPVVRSPCPRGPIWRASCAQDGPKQIDSSCSERGHGWPVEERQPRRWRCRSRTADRASKARMSDCMDAGVRAGARSASGKGSRDNRTLSRSPPQAQWSLVTFCQNRKSLACRRRAKQLLIKKRRAEKTEEFRRACAPSGRSTHAARRVRRSTPPDRVAG